MIGLYLPAVYLSAGSIYVKVNIRSHIRSFIGVDCDKKYEQSMKHRESSCQMTKHILQ